MLSNEDFEKLGERCAKGKEWIWQQPYAWGSKDPRVQRAIDLWFRLSYEWIEEAKLRKLFTDYKFHSSAWHKMKFEEALYKWQHTVKAKRGPDPRTLPRESFV